MTSVSRLEFAEDPTRDGPQRLGDAADFIVRAPGCIPKLRTLRAKPLKLVKKAGKTCKSSSHDFAVVG